jgi:hypothetical protein
MDYRLLPSISEKEQEDACIRFKFQELTPSHITTVGGRPENSQVPKFGLGKEQEE